jgi:plasmid stabilization system protein ParE
VAEEIVKDIFWTETAKRSFAGIIQYIGKNWTDREVSNFVNETFYLLANLQRQPEMCRPSLKRKYARIGIINKHTQIVYYYQPRKRQIVVLLFWGQKQNPAKFKY